MTNHRQTLCIALFTSVLTLPIAAPAIAGSTSSLFDAGEPAPASVAAATPSASVPAGPDAVELAALYYYAKEGEVRRVEAETQRLQAKYPGFAPPSDLYAHDTGPKVDEAPLWALYEKGDFAGIETELARLAAANAGWQPSEDFTVKLERRKLRQSIEDAASAHNWDGVIAAAGALDPTTETEIDLLWHLLDAYREKNMSAPMVTVYRGILMREGDRRLSDDILVTTLQKALNDFPVVDLKAAIEQFSAGSLTMAARLEPLRLDLVRREVAEYTNASTETEKVSDGEVAALEKAAMDAKSTADFGLLGWYRLKTGQPILAENWFGRAVDIEPTIETVQGLYSALSAQNKAEAAYALAVRHLALIAADGNFVMAALSPRFGKPELGDIDAAVVAAYATAIQSSHAAKHAEVIGWYAYNSRQFAPAEAWFEKSFEWEKGPDSLKGLLLARQQGGDKAGVKALREQYASAYPQVFEGLKSAVAPSGRSRSDVASAVPAREDDYLAAFRAKRFGDCIDKLRVREATGSLDANASLVKGWCHLELNHLTEARGAFLVALHGKGQAGEDAAYGLSLTLLRTGLTGEASTIVGAYPMSAKRDKELRAEIYWQQARASFDAGRYQQTLDALNARFQIAPETGGITQMRAWSHYHLGHLAEARKLFERADMVMSDSANRRALAIIRERLGG